MKEIFLSRWPRIVLIMATTFVVPSGLSTEPKEFQSGPAKCSLLEIYTSEGCSSCPPAELWFSALKENPRLWKDLVPVAFHVDYWDDLGWKDPFAAPSYSKRQRSYADRWRSKSVYTPGFVLDGKEWRGWHEGNRFPPPPRKDAGILTATRGEGEKWRIRYVPGSAGKPDTLILHGALLGFDLVSSPKRGENEGKTLRHDFVVLNLASVPGDITGAAFQGDITLKPSGAHHPKRTAAAFWISADETTPVLQAVGGWLE